jgi:hypothetical protein
MEYINNKVFGGNVNEGTYMQAYCQKYNIDPRKFDGIDPKDIATFTNMFFTTSSYSNVEAAIDAGAVVMTDVYSGHNCVIVGYQPSGYYYYIYMDPAQGCLQTASKSYFLSTYAIPITGTK